MLKCMSVYVLLLFCSDCKWWNSRRRLCKSDRGHSWSFWTCRVGPSSQQSLATAFVSTAVHCYASVIDSTFPVCDWICYASRTLDVSHWKVVMLSVCPKSHPQSVNLSMTVKRESYVAACVVVLCLAFGAFLLPVVNVALPHMCHLPLFVICRSSRVIDVE